MLDQVWSVYYPTAVFQRAFYHNYVINMRPHAVSSTLSCYGDGKARAIWLDEGAPQTMMLPNGDIKIVQSDGSTAIL